MERPTGDVPATGSSLVPSTGSVVPQGNTSAAMPAGLNPTPMTVDQGIFYQRVQEYFQFVQNNLMFLDESNIDYIRREAEERHTVLMGQIVQQLRSDFEAQSIQMRQTCVNEPAACRVKPTP